MKKLIALLLAIMLVISSVPFLAAAQDTPSAETGTVQEEATEEEPEAEEPAEETVEEETEEPAEPETEKPAEETVEEKAEEPAEPKAEEPAEPKAEEPAEPKAEEPAEPKAEEPAEPKAEEPAEPKAEEPAEPKAEEPAEPKAEEPAEPKTEEPAEPKAEEPAEPKAEEPAEPKTEEPAEPKAEEPAETKTEEPTEPKAEKEESGHFTEGYILISKGTKAYAEANKQKEAGSFMEEAVAYAVSEEQRNDPRKDWLKVCFAIEEEGELKLRTGYIQAESMRELTDEEAGELAARMDKEDEAPEYKGNRLPTVRFEETTEKEPQSVEEPQEATEEPEGKPEEPQATPEEKNPEDPEEATDVPEQKESGGQEKTSAEEKRTRMPVTPAGGGGFIASNDTYTQSGKLGTVLYWTINTGSLPQPVTCQWKYSDDNGQTWKNSSMEGNQTERIGIKVSPTAATYLYRCFITDGNGKGYYAGDVKVVGLLSGKATPATKAGSIGKSITFNANAYFTQGTVTYQWQYSTDNGKTWKNSTLSGNKTKTLKVAVTAARLPMKFRCVIRDSTGSVTTNAAVIFGVKATPVVKKANEGNTVRFTATTYHNKGTVTYQWQYSPDNGKTWKNSNQAGNKTKTLKVKVTAARMAMKFRCVVKDSTGTAISNAVSIFGAKATPRVQKVVAGQTVKLTATAYHTSGKVKYQWQYSTDKGKTWKNSGFSGNKTRTLTVKMTSARIRYYYRCLVTCDTGTVRTNVVRSEKKTVPKMTASLKKGSTGASIGSTVKLVTNVSSPLGTVSYTWQYSTDDGKTWMAAGLTGASPSITIAEAKLTYKYRCVVKDSRGSVTTNSIRLMDFTLGSPKPVYRALLIGETDFWYPSDTCNRNYGDVLHVASMLERVYGPGGSKYTVTKKRNLTKSEVESAIISTFRDTKDTDVSIFMIATHGNSNGDGELSMYPYWEDLSFSTLAGWLKKYVKGKVIVIIESCGAGSAIYKPGVAENSAGDAADDRLAEQAVQAFAAADPGITERTESIQVNGEGKIQVNTGELRSSKFYVLAAARHRELSWGHEGSDPGNYFTDWMIEGIGRKGSSPADASPKNSVITLEEAFNYVKKYNNRQFRDKDGYIYYQHVQRYPKNSKYPLFMFR